MKATYRALPCMRKSVTRTLNRLDSNGAVQFKKKEGRREVCVWGEWGGGGGHKCFLYF